MQLLNARAILPLRIAIFYFGLMLKTPSHLPKELSTRKSSQEEKKFNFETKKKGQQGRVKKKSKAKSTWTSRRHKLGVTHKLTVRRKGNSVDAD